MHFPIRAFVSDSQRAEVESSVGAEALPSCVVENARREELAVELSVEGGEVMSRSRSRGGIFGDREKEQLRRHRQSED